MPILSPADVQARNINQGDRQLLLDQSSSLSGITATAGGGQANAVPLRNQVNRVTTVVTAADSVMLPPAIAGTYFVTVINAAAANSMNVFPAVGDAINALAANAAIACAANKVMLFFCPAPGVWHSVLTA